MTAVWVSITQGGLLGHLLVCHPVCRGPAGFVFCCCLCLLLPLCFVEGVAQTCTLFVPRTLSHAGR